MGIVKMRVFEQALTRETGRLYIIPLLRWWAWEIVRAAPFTDLETLIEELVNAGLLVLPRIIKSTTNLAEPHRLWLPDDPQMWIYWDGELLGDRGLLRFCNDPAIPVGDVWFTDIGIRAGFVLAPGCPNSGLTQVATCSLDWVSQAIASIADQVCQINIEMPDIVRTWVRENTGQIEALKAKSQAECLAGSHLCRPLGGNILKWDSLVEERSPFLFRR